MPYTLTVAIRPKAEVRRADRAPGYRSLIGGIGYPCCKRRNRRRCRSAPSSP